MWPLFSFSSSFVEGEKQLSFPLVSFLTVRFIFRQPRILLYFSVMQDSPRVGVRWSIILLNGLSYKDAGEYRCQARNMAGVSEAPIKLKVMGVTSRLSKRKSVKTGSKPSSKYRKLYKSSPLSMKDKDTLQNITSSYFSREQMLTSWIICSP